MHRPYHYVSSTVLWQLRKIDLGPMWKKIGRICCCCCGRSNDDDEEEKKTNDESTENNGDVDGDKEENGKKNTKEEDKCEPSKYFLSMTRMEVLKWHLGGLLSVFGYHSCLRPADYQLIHHRNCYGLFLNIFLMNDCSAYSHLMVNHGLGYLVVHGTSRETKFCHAVDGIRMAEYMERYEDANLTKIHHRDRAKLTQLTSNTLFCRYCFQPIHEKHYVNQLTSPFMALTDLLSAVVLPIGLIPLVFILPILMIYEGVVHWARDDNEQKKTEKWGCKKEFHWDNIRIKAVDLGVGNPSNTRYRLCWICMPQMFCHRVPKSPALCAALNFLYIQPII